MVNRFEREFAKLHEQRYGVACNSGTSALHVALEAMKEKFGWADESEVLVPTITFIATSNACIHAGLKPVFVDVDPISYNMAASCMEKHITERTVAAIPVHTFGQPYDMDAILEVTRKYGLGVLEDCAEAHFATYKGKKSAVSVIWQHSVRMLHIRSRRESAASSRRMILR